MGRARCRHRLTRPLSMPSSGRDTGSCGSARDAVKAPWMKSRSKAKAQTRPRPTAAPAIVSVKSEMPGDTEPEPGLLGERIVPGISDDLAQEARGVGGRLVT